MSSSFSYCLFIICDLAPPFPFTPTIPPQPLMAVSCSPEWGDVYFYSSVLGFKADLADDFLGRHVQKRPAVWCAREPRRRLCPPTFHPYHSGDATEQKRLSLRLSFGVSVKLYCPQFHVCRLHHFVPIRVIPITYFLFWTLGFLQLLALKLNDNF